MQRPAVELISSSFCLGSRRLSNLSSGSLDPRSFDVVLKIGCPFTLLQEMNHADSEIILPQFCYLN